MARKIKSFNILSGHNFYTPGPGGMITLLLWLLLGAILGNLVSAVLGIAFGGALGTEYVTLISYPLLFVPALIYVGIKSRRNYSFETGYRLDSNHFGKYGGFLCAVLASVATIAAAFMTDLLSSHMPPMPEYLEELLESMTGGNIWVNLLSVSVFAPLFEEWLCRGQILRGLLNYSKGNGTRGIHPAWAIVISSLFFALIHANPWQAAPAFILGCLMGYIYYRTGSLKLTMIMHCVNNSFAVICANIDSLKDIKYWTDAMDGNTYAVLFAAGAVIVFFTVYIFSRIKVQSSRGNSDEVTA